MGYRFACSVRASSLFRSAGGGLLTSVYLLEPTKDATEQEREGLLSPRTFLDGLGWSIGALARLCRKVVQMASTGIPSILSYQQEWCGAACESKEVGHRWELGRADQPWFIKENTSVDARSPSPLLPWTVNAQIQGGTPEGSSQSITSWPSWQNKIMVILVLVEIEKFQA
ncbi:uncharacterized protein [Lolium perenne]|uniref:uncharacterized protein isoform X2 n=1 Tax=Lolium perenne TaxID=4522 RepID=UPI003A99629C